MQRRQLEAGDADPGGGAKRSRLTAACYALAVRLGCAAREPRSGGAADEKGSGKWSPRPTDSCLLEGGRKDGKGGGGEGEEVNETPPYLSATPRAAAPQVGGVAAAPPRFTPSTLRKQVCGARRHAIHTCRPNKRRLTIASCSHHARYYIVPRMLQVTVDHQNFAALISGGAAPGGAAGGSANVRTPSTGGSSRVPPSMLPRSPPTTPSPASGAASAAISRSLPGSGAATARSKVQGDNGSLAQPKRSSFSTKAPADAPVRSPRPPLALRSCVLRSTHRRACSKHAPSCLRPRPPAEAQEEDRELDAPCRVARPLAPSGRAVQRPRQGLRASRGIFHYCMR